MPSDFFAVLGYFCLLILMPGFLLFSLIFRDKKDFIWIDTIPLSFVFGLVFFTGIGLPAYLLHFSHTFFFILFTGVSALLLFLNIYFLILKKRDFVFEKSRLSVLLTIIFVILVLTLVLICFPSVYSGGDRWFHTGVMRRLAFDEPITPYFSLFKDVTNKIDSGYGYNIWHLAGSMIMRLKNINPNLIWEYLIIILTPIQLLSFGFLARKINKNQIFYFLALAIFVILAGVSQTGQEWRLSPYPDQVARNMMMPVILGLWILFLKKEKIDKGIFLAIVFSGLTLVLIHLFSVIYFLIAIGGMTVFGLLADKKYQVFKKGVLVLCGYLVLAAPILYLEYLNFLAIVPTSFGSASSKNVAVGNYAIVNPKIWMASWTYLTASAAVLLLLIWQLIQKRKVALSVLLCFVLVFFAAFLSFVPPVSDFVVKIITSTFLARMASIIPFYIIFALIIFELVKNNKILSRAAVVIFIVLLPLSVWHEKKSFLVQMNEKSQRMNDPLIKNSKLDEYINQNIPSDAVIAASPKTSYELFVATNNHVVMIIHQHCPAIVDKKERLADLTKMLAPTLANQNQALFSKYQVDYLISQGGSTDDFLNYPQAVTLVRRFNDANNYAIYKVNRSQ